jgi:hypothetical protein
MTAVKTSKHRVPGLRGREPLYALGFASILTAGGCIAFLLAGCGSQRVTSGGGNGLVDQRATVVLRSLARCVRAHGLPDFPDPHVGSDGVPRFPDSAPRVPVATQQACRTIAAQIPPQYTSTTAVSPADYERLLRLARCIRAHGIADWPDPNALGEFPIDPRIEHGGKALFVPAVRECARLNPNPNGGIHVVRAQPTQ